MCSDGVGIKLLTVVVPVGSTYETNPVHPKLSADWQVQKPLNFAYEDSTAYLTARESNKVLVKPGYIRTSAPINCFQPGRYTLFYDLNYSYTRGGPIEHALLPFPIKVVP